MNFLSFLAFVAALSLYAPTAFCQDSPFGGEEEAIENEINSAQGVEEPLEISESTAPAIEIPVQESRPKVNKVQSSIDDRRYVDEDISADQNLNRYPKDNSIFKKPPGPKKGGSVRLPHPRAAEGLSRINKDGSYQFKTAMKEKSQSASFRISQMQPPTIQGANSNVTYASMYGNADLVGLTFDYEWQPFRGFGSLGLQLGSGFWTTTAAGSFKRNPAEKSQENYNLFIIPLSAFLNYRFEFVRRQWVVPFINGGATFYGMAEVRDDGAEPSFAGGAAAGGGGGLMFSISRLDSESAFTLSQEYGIADMWLILEARAMKGLDQETDFTSQLISAGIAVDF